MEISTSIITQELLDSAMSWKEYMNLHESLVLENKSTGPKQTEALSKYTSLNLTRFHRFDKTLVLEEEIIQKLNGIKEEYVFLVFNESWCGDSAQSLPALAKMEEISDKLSIKVILRDEHLELMNNYLTNGTMSIPIVVILNKETLEEVAIWGPKPKYAMQLLADFKSDPDMTRDEFNRVLHTWYSKNKTVDFQYDIMDLLK